MVQDGAGASRVGPEGALLTGARAALPAGQEDGNEHQPVLLVSSVQDEVRWCWWNTMPTRRSANSSRAMAASAAARCRRPGTRPTSSATSGCRPPSRRATGSLGASPCSRSWTTRARVSEPLVGVSCLAMNTTVVRRAVTNPHGRHADCSSASACGGRPVDSTNRLDPHGPIVLASPWE